MKTSFSFSLEKTEGNASDFMGFLTSVLNKTSALLFWDIYNNPLIYITENGFSQSDPALLDDSQQWEYFRSNLQEIL